MIYAVASVSHVALGETTAMARVVIVALSAAALGASGCALAIALRQPRETTLDAFWRTVAAAGAVLAMIAIIWQTLPAFAPIDRPTLILESGT